MRRSSSKCGLPPKIRAYGVYRTVRCGGGRRRACRVRGGDGVGAHGPAHGAVHPEPRPDRADELQPGHRRHRQGTPRARGGRAGRHYGRGRRRMRHSVSPAQHIARPGRLVAARAVRQGPLPGEDARGTGGSAESLHQAGRGGRVAASQRVSESASQRGSRLPLRQAQGTE